MQLFHIDADKVRVKWNNIELSSVPELLSQLRKVLRIKKWDKICVQYSDNKQTTRYELSIQDWTDKDLFGEKNSSQTFSFPKKNVSMLIAMPNKREKSELIVQKLTEIGIQNVCFWISEHSIIRQRNEKKAERLDKISHEAVEQSRWIQFPEIKFLKSENELKDFIESNGGKVTGSVSKKTNYLVNNDVNSTSSKNKTAKELNIPIITEKQLIDLINWKIFGIINYEK